MTPGVPFPMSFDRRGSVALRSVRIANAVTIAPSPPMRKEDHQASHAGSAHRVRSGAGWYYSTPINTRLAHQSGDPLAPVPFPISLKNGVDAWHAIGRTRGGVDRADPLQQPCVSSAVSRRRPLEPSIVARRRHSEHARHGRDREAGLMRAHEPEDPDGRVPVSRARPEPPLLRGCRAPAEADAPRAGGGSARRRQRSWVPSPRGCPSCRPRSQPNCGSTERSARTHERGRRDRARIGPDRPSAGGTRAGTEHASWP